MNGHLYIVATPIGNLADLSSRAVQVLGDVDLILAEDTRHTRTLLSHFGIHTPMMSLHEHSSEQRIDQVLECLGEGKSLALVSDAGTPLISDPGYGLIQRVRSEGLTVLPVPGACAAIAALSVAGLATDSFAFHGFPPAKASARAAFFERLKDQQATLVFYESCHRIKQSVAAMVEVFGMNRNAFIGREMTKQFEQYLLGDLMTLHGQLGDGRIPVKGEFVVVIEGAPEAKPSQAEATALLRLLLDELPASRAAKVAAKFTGLNKRECFQICEDLKSGEQPSS